MEQGFLSKTNGNKVTFYLVQWTWGILLNIIGVFILVYALIKKWPIKKYRNAIYMICPPSSAFSGVNFGMFIVITEGGERSLPHEYGHTIQNLNWGLLMPFVINIPSAIRLWYREFKYYRKNLVPPTKYDDIWFEGQATKYGKMAERNYWNWL